MKNGKLLCLIKKPQRSPSKPVSGKLVSKTQAPRQEFKRQLGHLFVHPSPQTTRLVVQRLLYSTAVYRLGYASLANGGMQSQLYLFQTSEKKTRSLSALLILINAQAGVLSTRRRPHRAQWSQQQPPHNPSQAQRDPRGPR